MEIVIIILLLLLNGVFAMYEIALVSSSNARLEVMAHNGNRKAAATLKLLAEPEKILSTIQVGITLIGIVSGAFGGLTLSRSLAPYLAKITVIQPYADTIAVACVVGLITYFSLIIGELVPKSLALRNPERIACSFTPGMSVLTRIVYPFVWFLSLSTKVVNKLLGIKESEERAMTEEELKHLLKHSSEHGMIEQEESRMIKDVFRFTDKKAGELMTHRSDMVWIEQNASREEVLQIVSEKRFSRYPLCAGSAEEIVGVVAVKDMLPLFDGYLQSNFDLKSIAVQPLFIPESLPANKVLELFKQHKSNFGIVTSEYGLPEGIITLHDLTESILGEIPEEGESSDALIVQRHDGSFLVDGSIMLDDLMDAFNKVNYDDIKDKGFVTLGGLAMYYLHKVPAEGDIFEYKNMTFEIADMDGSRVDKLIVTIKDDE